MNSFYPFTVDWQVMSRLVYYTIEIQSSILKNNLFNSVSEIRFLNFISNSKKAFISVCHLWTFRRNFIFLQKLTDLPVCREHLTNKDVSWFHCSPSAMSCLVIRLQVPRAEICPFVGYIYMYVYTHHLIKWGLHLGGGPKQLQQYKVAKQCASVFRMGFRDFSC